MSHKATPEQWEAVRKTAADRFGSYPSHSVITELADRLAAAEQRIKALDAAANLQQQDKDAERAMEHQTLHTIALQMVDSLGRSFYLLPEILDTLRRAIREPMKETESCPHVVTSNEGTSYCRLTEHGNSSARLTSSPAPTGGLVAKVTDVITDSAAAYGTADEPARAAILAFAIGFFANPVLWIAVHHFITYRRG